ncbi:retrovirus-related pol polyprotein from transposon TNT 1-94 [Tanacetum coccineum]
MKVVIKCKTAKAIWNDLILAHEGLSDTRDTKIVALRLKFNTFKALEVEKVNGTFTRLKCLLNDLENNGIIIPQAEVNATFVNNLPRKWLSMNQTHWANNSIKNDCLKFKDVEEDLRSSSELIGDLNAEYHERALLANQKRFYKRSGRVGTARKPIDKSNEFCFACGKQGNFQKECPSNKTSTPSYPPSKKSSRPSYSSSNKSYNKPKPFTHTSPQTSDNHQKDYKGKYKGLKAEIVVLTKKNDAMSKGNSEKGLKGEKGLVAESFDWDEESADARSGQWVEITMKKLKAQSSVNPSAKKDHMIPKIINIVDSMAIILITVNTTLGVRCVVVLLMKQLTVLRSTPITGNQGLLTSDPLNPLKSRVAYVNGLKHNLVSISQLCDANFKVLFTKTQETIFNQNDEVVLIAPRRRDVYVIHLTIKKAIPVSLPKPHHCIFTITETTWKSLMKRLMMGSSLVTLWWPKHLGYSTSEIIPENNITPIDSPILQDSVSPEEPPKLTVVDDHLDLSKHDHLGLANNLKLYEIRDNVINEQISKVQPSPTTISPLAEAFLQPPVPQDRWSREKHIELVKIIGEPLAGITTRSRIRNSEAVSARECLYVNFLSKMEPKKLIEALEEEGWIIAMQRELINLKKETSLHGLYGVSDGCEKCICNGKILEEVYVQQPPGFESSEFPNHISQVCQRYQANPKESHLVVVKRSFKYLKGTPNLGL